MVEQNPCVGFGVDAQYTNRYPGGLGGLCARYHDQLSHLSIVSLPSARTARKFRDECAGDLPVVHHLPGIAPADPSGPKLERLRKLNEISAELDARWCCEDIAIWSIGPYGIPYFTAPILQRDMVDYIADGINKMKDISEIPFCAEIPSFSIVMGDISLGEFFSRLVEKTEVRLVADVSHIFSYSIAADVSVQETLKELPETAFHEVHISGGIIDKRSDRRYLDTHSHLIPDQVFDVLAEVLQRAPQIACVTYEVGVGLTVDNIDKDMERLEATIGGGSWSPKL